MFFFYGSGVKVISYEESFVEGIFSGLPIHAAMSNLLESFALSTFCFLQTIESTTPVSLHTGTLTLILPSAIISLPSRSRPITVFLKYKGMTKLVKCWVLPKCTKFYERMMSIKVFYTFYLLMIRPKKV